MAKYRCSICGYVYDEEKEGVRWEELPADWKCPACNAPKSLYEKIEQEEAPAPAAPPEQPEPLAYDEALVRVKDPLETHMDEIHTLAVTGQTIIAPMATHTATVSWDDILLLGAQLDPLPLDEHAAVQTKTVIGPRASKPMLLESPVYVSHMSFGALSKEAKTALAMGAARAKTAVCSGEGGILLEERAAAYRYVFEYVPNLYSVTDENLQSADAIEIKIGQGTKPGMGGHLPGGKVTPEIAAIRGKPVGEDIISPSRFPGIDTPEDLRRLVEELRERSGGRPIGVKIAAGHIERDLAFLVQANPDFITLDGRGGATGASPQRLRDASSVPTIYALHRARAYLDAHRLDISLVITGGLRVSSDFAKAIAMGADAVAIASAALMALGCQQYRLCQHGSCPMGIATQEETLRKRLDVEAGAQRVANFLRVSNEELQTFCRISGHTDIHTLSVDDLCTISDEIARHTNIPHA